MDAPLPFGLPGATAFYLTFYILTLVIHVLFMNYVLAGMGCLAISAFRPRLPQRYEGGMTFIDVLRDWMPFALGAAITAGVAPLLFVQILYKRNFYTANLLLFHRWMAILPVLIVGFYLLYLLKSRWIERRPALVRVILSIGALACFAFTGLSWTENHLLSMDAGSWASLYASGSMTYVHAQLLPRLAMWALGAIPIMCVLVAWQLWVAQQRGKLVSASEPRRLASLAIGGIVLCVLCGAAYWRQLDAHSLSKVFGKLAGPYLAAAIIGLVLQIAGWLKMRRREQFDRPALSLCTAGLIITLLGMTMVREAIRLAAVDISEFYEQHAAAAGKGGLVVFLIFFAINAALITCCIRLTHRQRV